VRGCLLTTSWAPAGPGGRHGLDLERFHQLISPTSPCRPTNDKVQCMMGAPASRRLVDTCCVSCRLARTSTGPPDAASGLLPMVSLGQNLHPGLSRSVDALFQVRQIASGGHPLHRDPTLRSPSILMTYFTGGRPSWCGRAAGLAPASVRSSWLDMGEPLRIVYLARQWSGLSGCQTIRRPQPPDRASISRSRFTGTTRRGKLYEASC